MTKVYEVFVAEKGTGKILFTWYYEMHEAQQATSRMDAIVFIWDMHPVEKQYNSDALPSEQWESDTHVGKIDIITVSR